MAKIGNLRVAIASGTLNASRRAVGALARHLLDEVERARIGKEDTEARGDFAAMCGR